MRSLITKSNPGFVPLEEYHKYRWLIPSEGYNNWYYRIPSPGYAILPTSEKFIETVDSELKEAVSYLISLEIPTTPSCSGHFTGGKDYDSVYEKLKRDAELIRKSGILLRDPVNDDEYLFKSSQYYLPWGKNSFIEKATSYQNKGVVGIYDPSKIFLDRITNRRIQNSQVLRDGETTIFLTDPGSEGQLKKIWREFTKAIKNLD